MKEHNFNINILSVLVEKIFEKVWHWFIGYVATYHNMSEKNFDLINLHLVQLTEYAW